jgi:opacity protein-like surface antigen
LLPARAAHKPEVSTLRSFFYLLVLASVAATAISQTPDNNPYYARKNTFSFLGAYSNDSSHILLGVAENRKLVNIGAGYSRRLFLNRLVNWQYSFEILPVALDSDPLGYFVNNQTSPTTATYQGSLSYPLDLCSPVTTPYSVINDSSGTPVTYSGTETVSCKGRRWVMGEAISPIGFQWNFMPRKKLQPIFSGHGGYMYSTKPVPDQNAGSFNFTFDLGAGFELYRSKSRSIRAEYRYHHISNAGTAQQNPGIDNGVFQLTYSFGR